MKRKEREEGIVYRENSGEMTKPEKTHGSRGPSLDLDCLQHGSPDSALAAHGVGLGSLALRRLDRDAARYLLGVHPDEELSAAARVHREPVLYRHRLRRRHFQLSVHLDCLFFFFG